MDKKLMIIAEILTFVVILLIIVNLSSGLFNLDLFSTASELDASMIETIDSSEADPYSEYELEHDGMILERNTGEDGIAAQLASYDIAMYCEGCSSCGGTTFGGISTVGCQSCASCDGLDGSFSGCVGCEGTSCLFCDDTSEYALCKDIKSCIMEYYSDQSYAKANGCFLEAMTRNEGQPFDIDDLKDVIASCNPEPIMMNMGGDVEKELCYFDPSSISYYDVQRPHDFYMKNIYQASNLGQITVTDWNSGFDFSKAVYVAFDDNVKLPAFRDESGMSTANYRVYVAIKGTPNSEFYIRVGNASRTGWFGTVVTNYHYRNSLGEDIPIKTDANGFAYTEFSEINGGWDDWRRDLDLNPERNDLNAVIIAPVVASEYYSSTVTDFYVGYYYDDSTSESWSSDLRYSKCNFATDIDPFLSPMPTWSDSFSVSSPWQTSGSADSSVKVFYDSSSPFHSDDVRGRVKLQLGSLDTNFMKNCMFDLYVCNQDSFAEYEDESILDLNDFISYFNPSNVYRPIDVGAGKSVMLYNTFEFRLDKDYTVDELKSAIRTGFMHWEQSMFPYLSYSSFEWLSVFNNDGLYQGNWESPSASASYSEDCWNSQMLSAASSDKRVLMGSCSNGICSGTVKIRIAFEYVPPTKDDLQKKPLYPTVAFCGK